MAWPTKVFSNVHNGEVFEATTIKCDNDGCGHMMLKRKDQNQSPTKPHSKFRTSVDDEADRIIRSQVHPGGDIELLCVRCGYHSLSKSCIDIRMTENDYSSLK